MCPSHHRTLSLARSGSASSSDTGGNGGNGMRNELLSSSKSSFTRLR